MSAEFSRLEPVVINRTKELTALHTLLQRHPVVGIIGARQVGKTTLARTLAEGAGVNVNFFDLENPGDLARLRDPMLALRELKGLVIIDEIQRAPDLFQVLRVLVDRPDTKTHFLVLGSASPELLRQTSETLAGRIIYHELSGFAVDEIDIEHHLTLWLRGGFPRSYLAPSNNASDEWRRGFIRTFLERDLAQLGFTIQAPGLRRFWTMLAHYHGQIWNASEFSRSFGVADTTIRRYLDMLASALVVWQLHPWHENISKRQVKAPKVYISDSGLLHALLNIQTLAELEGHPKVGASWEGFVLKQAIRQLGAREEECFFWATHGGAELDLLIVRGQIRVGIEIKRTTAPEITRSMRSALTDLRLHMLHVIHAGDQTFKLAENVRAVAFKHLLKDLTRKQIF